MGSKTNFQLVIWHVYWDSNCNGIEDIGYFQNEIDAEMARAHFANKNRIKEDGLCCSNSKTIIKQKIFVN